MINILLHDIDCQLKVENEKEKLEKKKAEYSESCFPIRGLHPRLKEGKFG